MACCTHLPAVAGHLALPAPARFSRSSTQTRLPFCPLLGQPANQRWQSRAVVRASSSNNSSSVATGKKSAELVARHDAPAQTPQDHVVDVLARAVKPAVMAALVGILLSASPDMAEAAQGGGRVGGSSFSSSRRSYAPPPSTTYIAPSPSVVYSTPFFAPAPFFSPFSFGPTIVVGGGGGGGLFSLLLFGVLAFVVVTAVQSFLTQSAEEEMWEQTMSSSVVRLQVGLMGTARQLQKDLEKMALRADTSSPEGLHMILQETVLALLRNPDYCIYGYTTSDVTGDSYAGKQAFNRLSMEERSKFKEETLTNVGGMGAARKERAPKEDRMTSEYIVVTILAATEGKFQLPEVRSAQDLRAALTQLGSITSDDLQAVEVLWTPENDEDTLSTQDMLSDYPLLRPL